MAVRPYTLWTSAWGRGGWWRKVLKNGYHIAPEPMYVIWTWWSVQCASNCWESNLSHLGKTDSILCYLIVKSKNT